MITFFTIIGWLVSGGIGAFIIHMIVECMTDDEEMAQLCAQLFAMAYGIVGMLKIINHYGWFK